MQRITGYKTSDGIFFEKKKEADAHESTLVAQSELYELAKKMPMNDDLGFRAIAEDDDFVTFILNNREALLNILKKIKE